MQTYLQNIEIAFLLFPLIIFFSFLPFILYQYLKHGYANGGRILVIYSFFLFLITAYFMVILPLPEITPDFCKLRAGNTQISLEFFRFFREMAAEAGTWSIFALFKTKTFIVTAFNFLLLLPLGFFLRYLYKMKWYKVLLISFLTSLFFEISQLSALFGIYPCPYRLFEIDDLITNTSGAMLGFLIFKYLRFLPDITAGKQKKIKIVNKTQIFLIHIFDFLIFSFLVNLSTDIFHNLSFLHDILLLITIFLIYFVLIPNTNFKTTLVGKLFSLTLKKEGKKVGLKTHFIFYGILILFPVIVSEVTNYLVATSYYNGIYALIWIVLLFTWFILVVVKTLFNPKKGLQNILSKSSFEYIDKE